jgi:biotin--protein ligase
MQQILVYVDEGVDGLALKQVVKSLQKEVDTDKHPLKRMDAKGLIRGGWQDQTALLIIPGGRDVYYHAKLDGLGTEIIRSYVENGGSYLGICAGAYFASKAIEFEKGGSLEVCGNRSLMFYPGVATGPAYGKNKYQYDGFQGAEAAYLSWEDGSPFHAYFNGGCQFVGAHEHPSVKILGSYLDLDETPAAIVECLVGKGRALLSGAHIEYSADHLRRDQPELARLIPSLQEADHLRREVYRTMLGRLSIKLKI